MRFNDTVTLYDTVEEDFKTRLVPRLLEGVYAEKTRGAVSAAEGDKNADALLLMIPFSGFSDVSPNVGDPVAVGDTGAAESFAELAARAEVFRIVSVTTFASGGLKHWEAVCR